MQDSLYEIDSVPFCNGKMLIPKKLRGQVLEGLHIAHQGPTGMLSNARQRFFWPGLDAAICAYRSTCAQCNTNTPSQTTETPIPSPIPTLPFQQVVTDLFQLQGHTFLVYADRYSGWLDVYRASGTDFTNIKKAFLAWFATYGIPEELASDGGPPFNSNAFNKFYLLGHPGKDLPGTRSCRVPQSCPWGGGGDTIFKKIVSLKLRDTILGTRHEKSCP